MTDADFVQRIWDDTTAMARAQAELARNIETAPRVVYLLWHDGILLGICGTMKRAEQERTDYMALPTDSPFPITIEARVVHP
jgi:hypothetical protein